MSEQCNASGCANAGSCPSQQQTTSPTEKRLQEHLQRIKHTILVMSGKGGVGKSTVAANMAVSLALEGKKVGLLDIDFHGPSIPVMLGLSNDRAQSEDGLLLPVEVGALKVMSLGFLVEDKDAAVIWRGPMKMGVIQQLIGDVAWGDLEYLIIDSPPGTGDEPLSVCQIIPGASGAVIVTTPQSVAVADVRRSITFCRQLNLPVLGVVENMSGFACPKCGEVTEIFKSGGGEEMAKEMNVPFLGRIPLDPSVAHAGDDGKAYIYHFADTPTAVAMKVVMGPVLALCDALDESGSTPDAKGDVMRIAIPMADGQLAMHFGHCQQFAVLDVDSATKQITKREDLTPPPHEPGVLPKWLAELGATHIIAGGMGSRAQGLFAEQKIQVQTGAPSDTPEAIVAAFLDGTLQTGENVCDH